MTNLHTPLIQVKKLVEDAKLPERANPTDSGADVFASEDVVIAPTSRSKIHTGIAISIPFGYDIIIKDKSGRAAKQGLTVLGGVIDQGYTGELQVVLFNTSNTTVSIGKGEKIAQIVCRPVEYPKFFEVDSLVNEGQRGEGGFGSTGLK